MRLSKAEARILEQYWKLGTSSVREILDSLPEENALRTRRYRRWCTDSSRRGRCAKSGRSGTHSSLSRPSTSATP